MSRQVACCHRRGVCRDCRRGSDSRKTGATLRVGHHGSVETTRLPRRLESRKPATIGMRRRCSTVTPDRARPSAVTATRAAIGAPHENSAARGVERQAERQVAARQRCRVHLRPERRRLAATSLRQGFEPADEQRFGHVVVLSADGNTTGGLGVLRGEQAKGINGNQSDDSIPQAGAVYVFTRTGTTGRSRPTSRPPTRAKRARRTVLATAISSALDWRSAMTARPWQSGLSPKTAAPPASTETRPTTPRCRRARCTSSRAPATPGRSRPT